MGILDGLLGQIAGNPDIENLATKIGLTPEQVQMAVSALGVAHPQPGDTVTTAAAATGLPSDKLQEIVNHIGGEGSLASFASMLDRDGDGNPINDITGMLGGLLGKK